MRTVRDASPGPFFFLKAVRRRRSRRGPHCHRRLVADTRSATGTGRDPLRPGTVTLSAPDGAHRSPPFRRRTSSRSLRRSSSHRTPRATIDVIVTPSRRATPRSSARSSTGNQQAQRAFFPVVFGDASAAIRPRFGCLAAPLPLLASPNEPPYVAPKVARIKAAVQPQTPTTTSWAGFRFNGLTPKR